MSEELQLLNVGCGQHFHRDWVNVDFVSVDKAVQQHDLRQGINQPSNQFDMVYHSHVLEHFSQTEGRAFLAECHRVLKPGGVLRIAVPDLEQIAKLYLENLSQAWQGDGVAQQRYDWMKMELLDQMTRHQSGGSMGPFMVQAEGPVADFLSQRLGREVSYATGDSNTTVEESAASKSQPVESKTVNSKPMRLSFWQRQKKKLLKALIGKDGIRQLEIGRFRDSGEVHRWMYDRFSLRQVCLELGFEAFAVRSSTESYLEAFAEYELDSVGGTIRKPDSLFIECRKPAESMARKQVA